MKLSNYTANTLVVLFGVVIVIVIYGLVQILVVPASYKESPTDFNNMVVEIDPNIGTLRHPDLSYAEGPDITWGEITMRDDTTDYNFVVVDADYVEDYNSLTIDSADIVSCDNLVICWSGGGITIGFDKDALTITGDTDKMDEAAKAFFNEYIKPTADAYIKEKLAREKVFCIKKFGEDNIEEVAYLSPDDPNCLMTVAEFIAALTIYNSDGN